MSPFQRYLPQQVSLAGRVLATAKVCLSGLYGKNGATVACGISVSR